MSDSRLTLALGALTGVILLVSIPGALRENMDRGEVYLFGWRFLAELPKRLAGPGRFRFVLQPALATLLGARDGIADARAGNPCAGQPGRHHLRAYLNDRTFFARRRTMQRFVTMGSLVVLGILSGAGTQAQIKEIPGERVTQTGTVEAIDHQQRVLTLKKSTGEFVTVDVPADAQRFDAIKVGDKVTATYYDNVVVRLKAPGEASTNKLTGALTPSEGVKPGATLGAQRTMTATVEAIDPKVPSISFKGPNGWKYSRRIMDKNVLKQVKVGDQVDFTWTEAIQLTVEGPGK